MAVEFVGYNSSFLPDVDPLAPTGSVADGDWVFWFVYYTNDITVAFTDPTGWTQLRKTIGTIGTIELWRYHWSTGDPTDWALTTSGGGGPAPAASALATVFRGVASTPTIVSTTHETTAAPVLVDSITDAAIGANDLALAFMAVHNGTADASSDPDVEAVVNSGSTPGISEAWWRVGSGFAPSRSVSVGGGSPTDTFGLQIILDDQPFGGGWGVGQVRMGAN